MTTDRDVAPVIRSWLRDGPDGSAEQVLDRALAVVDLTPQRSAARWPARRFDMNLIVRLGVAAAVLAVAAALGYSLLQNVGSEDPAPNPSLPASTDGPEAASLPEELGFLWIAEPREVDGLDVGDRLLMDLRNEIFSVSTDLNVTTLVSAARPDGPGALRLETVGQGTGCEPGDAGTYRFALSPGGSILTIQPGTDDCAVRQAATVGEWRRSACVARETPCRGVLEGGRQSSLLFDPFREDHNPATARYGAMSYEVPDGWANADDRTHFYTLMRAEAYETGDTFDCLDCPDGMWIGASPSASRLDCIDQADEDIGTSADALLDWLRAHPGLDVAERDPVTVSGRPTFVFDIAAPESYADPCLDQEHGITFVPLFAHPGYHYGIRTGDRHRLYFVTIEPAERVGDGVAGAPLMLIGVDSLDPDALEALIAETEPIIESIELRSP